MQKIFHKIFTTIGIIFVILAVLILVDALNILHGPWGNHLGLTFLFLVIFIFLIRWRFTFLSTLFLSFIVMLHKAGLGMAHVSNWTILGIAILIGIGLAFLYHPHINYVKKLVAGQEPTPFATIEDQQNDTINIYSRFSDTNRDVTGDINKVNIDTHYSNVGIHFDNATLEAPTATINLNCRSSAVTLFIPLEWNLDDQLDKISSKVTINGSEHGSGTKTIYLTGHLAASNLTITRV